MIINEVTISGNLVREAEIMRREGEQGEKGAFACFTIAVNEYGKGQQYTAFVKAKAYGKVAEKVARMSKGQAIVVRGKIWQNSYETKTGEKRNETFVSARYVDAYIYPRNESDNPDNAQCGEMREEMPPVPMQECNRAVVDECDLPF